MRIFSLQPRQSILIGISVVYINHEYIEMASHSHGKEFDTKQELTSLVKKRADIMVNISAY